VVDHLLVFKGQGEIKDFPGNYTQYREWSKTLPQPTQKTVVNSLSKKDAERTDNKQPSQGDAGTQRRRMSFKEKREFEQLEKEIAALEEEKTLIEEALCSGTLGIDELTEKSKRLPLLNDELDEKSMRWLELSELN